MAGKSNVTKLPMPVTRVRDPLNINGRLYAQIDALLNQLENPGDDDHITLKERIAALIAIARIQVVFVGLRKEKVPDELVAGSAVRKYAQAFANDARRGKKRPRPEPEPDDREGVGDADSDLDLGLDEEGDE